MCEPAFCGSLTAVNYLTQTGIMIQPKQMRMRANPEQAPISLTPWVVYLFGLVWQLQTQCIVLFF